MCVPSYVLFEHGFVYAWIAGEVGDVCMFSKQFEHRLFNLCVKSLMSKIMNSLKTISYKFFKSKFFLIFLECYISNPVGELLLWFNNH